MKLKSHYICYFYLLEMICCGWHLQYLLFIVTAVVQVKAAESEYHKYVFTVNAIILQHLPCYLTFQAIPIIHLEQIKNNPTVYISFQYLFSILSGTHCCYILSLIYIDTQC